MRIRPLPGFEKEFAARARGREYLYDELFAVYRYVLEVGSIPEEYKPHELVLPNSKFSGYWEFHLSESDDVLVIYTMTSDELVLKYVTDHKNL